MCLDTPLPLPLGVIGELSDLLHINVECTPPTLLPRAWGGGGGLTIYTPQLCDMDCNNFHGVQAKFGKGFPPLGLVCA